MLGVEEGGICALCLSSREQLDNVGWKSIKMGKMGKRKTPQSRVCCPTATPDLLEEVLAGMLC